MNVHCTVDATDPFVRWWSEFLRGRIAIDDVTANPLRVVDLFSGAGGFGLGAALAARSLDRRAVFGAIADTDEEATRVYARSLPVRRVLTDTVSMMVDHSVEYRETRASFDYAPEILDEALAEELARTDLLIAGPPCQGHSNLNNHTRRDDPRNDLFVATAAIGIAASVPAMVIENVPSVVNAHGEVVEIARSLLEGEGYAVASGVLRMDALGGWQTRRRYFMIAVRDGDPTSLERSFDDWRSGAGHTPEMARSALGCLWAIEDLEDAETSDLFDSPPVQGPENTRRIAALFERGLHDMPLDLRPDCHREGTTYGAVYGRMHADRPAPTITTGIGTPGQGRFIHPTRPRLITPREAARLQGFPDGYGFVGDRAPTRKSLAKWIGDAVPPFLGAIACGIALEASLGHPFHPPWAADGG